MTCSLLTSKIQSNKQTYAWCGLLRVLGNSGCNHCFPWLLISFTHFQTQGIRPGHFQLPSKMTKLWILFLGTSKALNGTHVWSVQIHLWLSVEQTSQPAFPSSWVVLPRVESPCSVSMVCDGRVNESINNACIVSGWRINLECLVETEPPYSNGYKLGAWKLYITMKQIWDLSTHPTHFFKPPTMIIKPERRITITRR